MTSKLIRKIKLLFLQHEINEVFELHKARQRSQQLEQNGEQLSEPKLQAEQLQQPSDETLSRSMESHSGFNSASGGGGLNHKQAKMAIPSATTTSTTAAGNANSADDKQIDTKSQISVCGQAERITTKLTALPPPPLSPSDKSDDDVALPILQLKPISNGIIKRAVKAKTAANASSHDDVNIWANKFLKDLDNLMANPNESPPQRLQWNYSQSAATSPTVTTSPMLLSAAATAAIQSRYGRNGIAPPQQQLPASSPSSSSSPETSASPQQMSTNGMLLRPEKHVSLYSKHSS